MKKSIKVNFLAEYPEEKIVPNSCFNSGMIRKIRLKFRLRISRIVKTLIWLKLSIGYFRNNKISDDMVVTFALIRAVYWMAVWFRGKVKLVFKLKLLEFKHTICYLSIRTH